MKNKFVSILLLFVAAGLVICYFALNDKTKKEEPNVESNSNLQSNIESNKPSNPVSNNPSNNPSNPGTNKPTSNNPTSNKPTSNKPTSNKPTSNKPTSNKPTSNKPTSNPTSNVPIDNRVVLSSEYYNTSTNREYDEYNMELLLDKYRNNEISDVEYNSKNEVASEKQVAIFNKLVSQKKSFIVFEYRDFACANDGSGLRDFVKKYIKEQKVYIYITYQSTFEKTSLYKKDMYNKNVVIVKNGKVYKYLDYESDADSEVFGNYTSFKKWISKYVKI